MNVLLVEDNKDLASCVANALSHLGHTTVLASTIDEAGTLICNEELIDAALLDFDVAGQKSTGIAQLLDERNVPYAMTSGYARSDMPAALSRKWHVRKPYDLSDLERALRYCSVSQTSSTGSSVTPANEYKFGAPL